MAEIIELRLCETERLILRPNVLYRFTVASDCPRCTELGAIYMNPVTKRRLADGDRALALPEPTTKQEIAEQLVVIWDGMLALQSLDDLGSEEANNKAYANLNTLQGHYDQLKAKLKGMS